MLYNCKDLDNFDMDIDSFHICSRSISILLASASEYVAGLYDNV